MSRQSSIPNGARPIMTQTSNVPQQQHDVVGPRQFVRGVPAQRPSPGTVPTKLQPDLGPSFPNPTRLQATSPSSTKRPLAPHQLPTALAIQQRMQNLQQPPMIPQSQAALMTFLDNAFRLSAERIQSELTNLRTVCTRAIFREQQDKERWRRHCVTFKQERDVARERVRALIGEREAHMVRAGAGAGTGTSAEREGSVEFERTQDDEVVLPEPTASRDSTPSSTTAVALPSPEDDANIYSLVYPSPTYMPFIDNPPPRSRSADAVLHRNYIATKKRDRTAFDITVTENPTGERRIRPAPIKKRRTSDSSASTAVEEPILESGASTSISGRDSIETEGAGVHDITNKIKALAEPSAHVHPSTPPPKSTTPKIELTHVDLMYVPTNGKLVCRACLLHCNKLPQSSRPTPKSFPTNAQWDVLRSHCMTHHPVECADVARLHPAEVYELRKRLMMTW